MNNADTTGNLFVLFVTYMGMLSQIRALHSGK